MEHFDVDSGLLESIQNMSVDELVALQMEAEASGVAQQLRAMMDCVGHLADSKNLPQLLAA